MQKIRCTSCDAKLKLPVSYSGDTVKCPRCGTPFSTSQAIAAQPTQVVEQPPIEQDRAETTANSSDSKPDDPQQPSRLPDHPADPTVTRQANGVAKKLPAFLDINFKRYWTPIIIRFSWFVVVIFAILWIGFLSVAYVGALFGGQNPSMLDSFGISELMGGSLNGKADVASLNKFLDDVSGSDSSGFTKPKTTTYQTIMSFGFGILSFLTLIISLVLTVLFCRVFFETIIMLFDISRTLKSIDEKTD